MNSAFRPSSNVAHITRSMTSAMSALARDRRAAGQMVIDLGQGQPDFPTPAFIQAAADRAMSGGATRYTPTEGIKPLREAVAADANSRWIGRGSIAANEVVITAGAKQALFNACFALFESGDEVLIPTPNWTSYYDIVALAKATPVPVLGDPAQHYKVDPARLSQAATARTRGLLLNSPCNPTGAVYTAREMAALASLAAERGWWLISDEVYRRIAYDEPSCSVLEVADDRDGIVVIDAVSKAFAMTGWRLGWAIGPKALIDTITALQSHTTSNAQSISQYAALSALTNAPAADAALADMLAALGDRRRTALAAVQYNGNVEYIHPAGAFYLYLKIASEHIAGADVGSAFAHHLLAHHGVAVVPGSAFRTPDWVRISYGAPQEDVAAGLPRIMTALREFQFSEGQSFAK